MSNNSKPPRQTLQKAARRVVEAASGQRLNPTLRLAIETLGYEVAVDSQRRVGQFNGPGPGRTARVDHEVVCRLSAEGMSTIDIAAQVGCTPNHVAKILRLSR